MVLILTLGGLALETHPVGCFAGGSSLLLLLPLGWETTLSFCFLTLGDMVSFPSDVSPQGVRRMSWKIASVAI